MPMRYAAIFKGCKSQAVITSTQNLHKKNEYTFAPQVYLINVGFKEVLITRAC